MSMSRKGSASLSCVLHGKFFARGGTQDHEEKRYANLEATLFLVLRGLVSCVCPKQAGKGKKSA